MGNGIFFMLSISQNYLKHSRYNKKIFKRIFDEDKYVFYKLYLVMNSTDTEISLYYFEILKKNETQFKLFCNLIVIINIIKCKIYGLCIQE